MYKLYTRSIRAFNHVRARVPRAAFCLREVAVSEIKGKSQGYQMEIYFVIILEFRSGTYHYIIILLSDKKSGKIGFVIIEFRAACILQ